MPSPAPAPKPLILREVEKIITIIQEQRQKQTTDK